MLKAKNKNVVDIIFNNKHAVKVYKGLELVWQKIADLLHLTQVCGNSVQEPPNISEGTFIGGISSNKAYCYKNNFITSPYSTTRAYQGVATYFKAKPNTTYSVSGNVSGNRYVHIASYASIDDISSPTLSTMLGTNLTFTTLDDTEYVVVAWTHSTVGSVITFSDIKVVEDSQPSPSNPIEIKSVGDKTKNLFNLNGDITLGYRLNTTTGIGKKYGTTGPSNDFITDGAYCVSELMEIKPNTNYAKNTPATAYYRIHFYDSDKICVSVTNSSIAPSPANAKYMAICLPIAELGNNIQVEENSVVTDYVPFGYKLSVDVNGTISTCYLDEPLRKVGNEWDEIYRDDDGYHIERRIGKCDLLSTMDWQKQNISTFNCIGVYAYGLGTQIGVANLGITYPDVLYCNRGVNDLAGVSTGAKTTNAMMFNALHNNLLWNVNVDDVGLTVDTFKAWLNDNPTYILYVLANSTFEDIEWDVEPEIPPTSDVVFLTEIQPSDYTIE